MVLGLEFATREFLEYVFFCKFELRICVVRGIFKITQLSPITDLTKW